MSIVYKILFEVRLLHEFYLTEPNGQNVFNLAAQSDRISFLFNRFQRNERNINNDLGIDLDEATKKMFENNHMRLLPAYAGFKVAIKVDKQTLPDGTLVYRPKLPLPDNLNIPVMLVKKNDILDGYTNSKMKRNSAAAFFFSNENIISTKFFPALSSSISPFDASITYEQGEPAFFGPNDIREFYIDKDGNVQWLNISGDGFVNENDRILFPRRFSYSLNPADNITGVDLVLKDKNGNPVTIFIDGNGSEIKQLSFSASNPLQKITADFSTSAARGLPGFTVDDNIVYTLEIKDNNGVVKTQRLIFFDDTSALRSCWGLVNIKTKVTNIDFNLVDNTGFLITRRMPDNSIFPPPIFEVRIKSRLSFWRYINDKKKKLKNDQPDFLFEEDDNLVTTIPRPLTHTPTLFKKPDNSLHYLPNPTPFEIIKTESQKQYTDILVAESALFPLEP